MFCLYIILTRIFWCYHAVLYIAGNEYGYMTSGAIFEQPEGRHAAIAEIFYDVKICLFLLIAVGICSYKGKKNNIFE